MESKDISSLSRCFKIVSAGFGLGVFYALFIVGGPILSLKIPAPVLTFFWTVVKALLGVGLLCLYQPTKDIKIAAAGILLVSSAVFSLFPLHNFLTLAVEALAITSLSLVLFDLNKLFPGLKLSVPAGLLFLGVIFSILNNPMMQSLAGFAWLFGFVVAAGRINILSRLKLNTKA